MSQTTKPAKRGRHTVARHGELKSPHPLAMLLKILGIVVGVVLVSGLGVAAYAVTDITASFTEDAVELEGQDPVPPDIGAIEGGVSLLLVGTDECEEEYAYLFGKRCTGADAGGQLNDVNMLVHISNNPRRVTVVSFPRDLMIPIPSCTREDGSTTGAMSKQQLNSSWSYGGLSCVNKTISELSGQSIPFAAKVSFGNVINITDAIGGVDVCIGNGGMRDSNTGINWAARHPQHPGRRSAAVPSHAPRPGQWQRPRAHQQPAAVHVIARPQARERGHAVRPRSAVQAGDHGGRQHHSEPVPDQPA